MMKMSELQLQFLPVLTLIGTISDLIAMEHYEAAGIVSKRLQSEASRFSEFLASDEEPKTALKNGDKCLCSVPPVEIDAVAAPTPSPIITEREPAPASVITPPTLV